MSIVIAQRIEEPQTRTFALALCPNDQGGTCACPKDEHGNPAPGHPLYHFPRDPQVPPGSEVPTPEAWEQSCGEYAVQLETAARGGA